MRQVLMLLGAALSVCAPAWAQAGTGTKSEPAPKNTPAKEEPKKEEPRKDAVDGLNAYRTKGNTWTIKSTTKMEGLPDTVSYVKYEVTDVTAEKATVKMTTMDKDQKETFSYSTDYPFAPAKPAEPTPDAPKVQTPKVVEEKIKVEAGEIECTKTETEISGIKSTTWMHKKYPAIMVKMTSKGDTYEASMELIKVEVK